VETKPTAPTVTTPTTTNSGTVNVASGDTLWKLASANGLTVAALKALNNLTSDYVYPGQSLVLTKSTQTVTAVQTVTPVVTKTNAGSVYTVQKGDTLYKIAVANGISIADLKTINDLNSDIIFVNQTLKVNQTATANTTTAVSDEKTYTVKKGDTLYSIAKASGTALTDLIASNDITSDTIYIGQVINL